MVVATTGEELWAAEDGAEDGVSVEGIWEDGGVEGAGARDGFAPRN